MTEMTGVEKPEAYSPIAKALHWLTVLFVIALFISGNVMTERAEQNIWDATTNALYSSHKLAGFTLLWIIVLRLLYRFGAGVPAHPSSLASWQVTASSAVHWALYGLLIAMPLAGWYGVSLFGAREVFGVVSLPAISGIDKDLAKTVFEAHETMAGIIFALVVVHVGAALMHLVVFRDGVFGRMWRG